MRMISQRNLQMEIYEESEVFQCTISYTSRFWRLLSLSNKEWGIAFESAIQSWKNIIITLLSLYQMSFPIPMALLNWRFILFVSLSRYVYGDNWGNLAAFTKLQQEVVDKVASFDEIPARFTVILFNSMEYVRRILIDLYLRNTRIIHRTSILHLWIKNMTHYNFWWMRFLGFWVIWGFKTCWFWEAWLLWRTFFEFCLRWRTVTHKM